MFRIDALFRILFVAHRSEFLIDQFELLGRDCMTRLSQAFAPSRWTLLLLALAALTNGKRRRVVQPCIVLAEWYSFRARDTGTVGKIGTSVALIVTALRYCVSDSCLGEYQPRFGFIVIKAWDFLEVLT